MPLPFPSANENVAFKVFGMGSQFLERNANYGIPSPELLDWHLGLTMTLYGFDLTVAYTGTNISYAGCLDTYNCEARAILTVNKAF